MSEVENGMVVNAIDHYEAGEAWWLSANMRRAMQDWDYEAEPATIPAALKVQAMTEGKEMQKQQLTFKAHYFEKIAHVVVLSDSTEVSSPDPVKAQRTAERAVDGQIEILQNGFGISEVRVLERKQ